MERTVFVSTLEEAAAEGYRQGFEEGYAAARIVIKTIADTLREQEGRDVGFDAVHALDMSREKAKKMLGSPDYKVSRVPLAVIPSGNDSGSNLYQ